MSGLRWKISKLKNDIAKVPEAKNWWQIQDERDKNGYTGQIASNLVGALFKYRKHHLLNL